MVSRATTASMTPENFVVGFIHTPTSKEQFMATKQRLFRYKTELYVLGYITTVIGGSQVALLLSPAIGAYANVVALVSLILLAARNKKAQITAITASTLPAAAMVGMSLPQTNALMQAAIFYSTIFALGIAYHFVLPDQKATQKLAWKNYLLLIPTMIVLGQLLGALAYGILRNQTGFGHVSLPIVTLVLVLFGVAEEVFFRGTLQYSAGQALRPAMAVVLTATLYTVMTLPLGSWAATLFAASASILLSGIYYVKPSIVLTTIANLTLKLLFVGLIATFL